MFKRGGTRSILESASIRAALSPRNELNQNTSFSSVGTYDENTDLAVIHKYVLETLQKGRSEVDFLKSKADQLRSMLATTRLRMVDRRYYEDEIMSLESQVKGHSSNEKEKQYLRKSQEVLAEWMQIKKEEGPYFKFGEIRKFSPEKLSVVRSYIQIASQFVPLDLTVKQEPNEGRCPYCRNVFQEEEGKVVCNECGIYQDALTHDAEYGDRAHINSSSNNGYMNKETFMKALDCYQGRQRTEFPTDLKVKFDEYCKFKGKNKNVLNYELTRSIFKEIGYSGYFDDINLFLFMHPEIRKPLPDLSKVEDLVLQDYDQFSAKYPEVKGDERDSALNAWYILYIICRRRKIPCNKSDLKMPDTREIRISNDNIARKVFEALSWKFEDTV